MSDHDRDLRAAESRLLAHFGLTMTEHAITVPTGNGQAGAGRTVGVRLLGSAGDASPPVIFLHGIGSTSAAALPLMSAAVQAGCRVLALDWPGHGFSGPCVLPAGADIRAHVTGVLDAVLDGLGIDVADLAGHSLGGQFSLHYTIARPARVRRLVLLGAPGAAFAETRVIPFMRAAAIPGLGRALLSLPASRAQYRRTTEITLGKGVLDRWPADLAETGYLAARRPGFPKSVASFFRCLATPAGVRPRVTISDQELRTITAPVLLIWGDRDVFLAPAGAAARISCLGDARLVIISGGHAPWLDDPQASSRALTEFLTRS
jgi:pimeloyl-ACP methyl ester carboxylesterase